MSRSPRALLPRLLLLGALWGAAFMFLRLAAPEFGAFALAGARVGLAALLMLAFVLATARALHWRERWRRYVAVGGVNTALPFLLYSFAALHIPAGYSAIGNATVPVWSALIAWRVYHQHLGRSVWLGIAVAFVGVYVLVGLQPVAVTALSVLGMAAALAGAALYAVSGYLINRHFAGGDGVTGATGMVLGAFVWLLLPALMGAPPKLPSASAWIAVALLAIFCTAIGYILFFGLIRDYGPQRAATVAFLFPAFAALWGFLVLGEPITLNMISGMAMVFAGMSLVSLSSAQQARIRAVWNQALDVFVLPLLYALVPAPTRRVLARRVARSVARYAEAAAAVRAGLADRLAEPALSEAVRDHRLARLADHADLWLDFTRPRGWADRCIVAEEPEAPASPALIVTFHFGGGWWLPVRWGARGRPVSIVMRRGDAPTSHWPRLLWRLGQFRMKRIEARAGAPLIVVEEGHTLAKARAAWRAGHSVLALIDLPPPLVDRVQQVRFLGREAWFPSSLVALATRLALPVHVYVGEADSLTLTPRYRLVTLAASDPADRLQEIVAHLEAALARRPGAWHGWSELELYFKLPERGA